MPNRNKDIVIVGADETAELAWEYLTHDSAYRVVAFAVEKRFLDSDRFCDLAVSAFESIEDVYPPSAYGAFVAVSCVQLNRPRANLFGLLEAKGYEPVSYVGGASRTLERADDARD